MRGRYYAAIVFILLLIAGCHYGAINKDFGNSYKMQADGQILNPRAGKNVQPVTGLDGRAADTVVKKYVDSFVQSPAEQAPSNFVVPVMSTGAGKAQDVYGK